MRRLPPDYEERVYAGVLGKTIGVYLGRPFEGWLNERIERELGEVSGYVHERLGQPLVVTDDDISGTFTFVRALADHGCRAPADLRAEQIGETWLNYVVPRRSIFWWGGMGNSTEHTAWVRLASGVPAPRSGSAALNGKVVSEQIGAQIFIDGWGLVCPGDPEAAARLAGEAARVSHDGEAVWAAQAVAAMVAAAFVEQDVDRLIDGALSLIPRDSVIARMAADLRAWHADRPDDWRATRRRLEAGYGYDRYGGNCHVVPNHGLILLALLHGGGDFSRSLMIVNTCGWDTDCNSGNVGCILGVRGGLTGIDGGGGGHGTDWRGPVADRLLLPTADGGRSVTDAVREACELAALGRTLAGDRPRAFKGGARFHFSFPGSVQGFAADVRPGEPAPAVGVENEGGRLAVRLPRGGAAATAPARAATPTFVTPEELPRGGYRFVACPTLYPGQTVRAAVALSPDAGRAVAVRLYVRHYAPGDALADAFGPAVTLGPGGRAELEWRVPDAGGHPVAYVGLEALPADGGGADGGTLYLDRLTWDGAPDVTFRRPPEEAAGGQAGTAWRRAWVEALDRVDGFYPEAFRLSHEAGTGLLLQGTREWTDYRVRSTVTPHLADAAGLVARAQGVRRYYALLLADGGGGDGGRTARLVKQYDGRRTALAEAPFAWELGRAYGLCIEAEGPRLRASLDGAPLFDVTDDGCGDGGPPLLGGAVGLLCEAGRVGTDAVTVGPLG